MPNRSLPNSASWYTLLAVPCVCFLVIFLLLYFLSPADGTAQMFRRQDPTNLEGPPAYDHEGMAPVLHAQALTGPVQIDGVLDEPVWQTGEAVSDFRQRDPDEGAPVSEGTEVRILVGSDALYIGAWLFDSEPEKIRATLVRRDVVSDFDYFMVNLDSRHDHNTSYAFTLTPSGAYQDAALGADGQYDFGWDPVWQGAASVDEHGWYAEWKIPFSQLRFEGGEGMRWGIQLTRVIARKRETAQFAFTPRAELSGPHRYGHLDGLGRVPEPRRLELLPYASSRSEHLNTQSGDPFRGSSEQFFGLGLDLKFGITSNLTLDATINPDFGQVEVDPAVVNLTQYETYFPERRPFFVEGSEIFRFGFAGSQMNSSDFGDLFYSRRVGRAPQRDLRSTGARFTDTPDQSTIAGAMKMSGRAGDWSLGFMEAATLEEDGRYVGVDGQVRSAVVEPFSNYVVGRARRDFREGNSTVGGILTAVSRDLRDQSMADLLHSGAYVAGVDFNHMWNNREWFVTGTLAGSRVQGSEEAILLTQRSSARYWQRPDAGHVEVDPSRTSIEGWRGSVSAGRRAGDHWLGSVLAQAQSPGFEANDLGFETRVDSWDLSGALQYRDMEPGEIVRSVQVDFLPGAEWNFDGDLLGLNVFLGSVQEWSNYWQSSTAVTAYPETDNDRLTRGGPVARGPGGYRISQWVATDGRKPYRLNMNLSYARNARGGWGIFPSVGVTFRPRSAVEVSLSPTYSESHAVAQYVGAVTDETASRTFGRRYVFSDLDQKTLSVDTRLSWTFTPRLSLQLYMQPFLASGEYSRFKEMHEPRRWDWDVYGEERGTLTEVPEGLQVDPDGSGPADHFLLSNPDFNMRSLRGNAVLRWEYRPGSTVYLVWQQRRSGLEGYGEMDLTDDTRALFRESPENVFAVKVSFWVGS